MQPPKRAANTTNAKTGAKLIASAAAWLLVGLWLVELASGQPPVRPRFSRTSTTTSTTSTTTPRPPARRAVLGSLGNNNNNNNSARNANLAESHLSGFVEDELPADFYEMPAEQLDLGMNATGRAPVPVLSVAVLQNGRPVDQAITVQPGTPLEMVIYLDDKSAKVYGLQASQLRVQDDTFRQREELIISGGCSLDTYIFGNFEAHPEDQSMRAKFRAFKFPESSFVRFVGTVNVCIKQCERLACSGAPGSGGEASPGRQRRSASAGEHNNKARVTLTVSTVLRIGA